MMTSTYLPFQSQMILQLPQEETEILEISNIIQHHHQLRPILALTPLLTGWSLAAGASASLHLPSCSLTHPDFHVLMILVVD